MTAPNGGNTADTQSTLKTWWHVTAWPMVVRAWDKSMWRYVVAAVTIAQRYAMKALGVEREFKLRDLLVHQQGVAIRNLAEALRRHTERSRLMGDGLNGAVEYMQLVERELHFYASNSDALKRVHGRWLEMMRQEEAVREAQADPGIIKSAGTTDVEQAAKSTEPTLDIIPIRGIRDQGIN